MHAGAITPTVLSSRKVEGPHTTTDKKPAIAEAVSAATDQLIASLKAGKSEELTRYIKAMSIFHSYSFSNTMMIICQRPDATRVAGFRLGKPLVETSVKARAG